MLFKDRTTFHERSADALQASLSTVVASRLNAAGALDASDLRVIAYGSEVMISGSLSCREEVDRAIEAAMVTPGVTKVNHTIFVRSF